MAFGGLDKEEFQAPMAEINTTPLVDVMLVLLVIFLVTAPMLTHAVKLELPNETAVEVPKEKAITISIDSAGAYYWDDHPLSENDLKTRFSNISGKGKQPIHLRIDKRTPYEKVSFVLTSAQKYGITNIGFLTEPR